MREPPPFAPSSEFLDEHFMGDAALHAEVVGIFLEEADAHVEAVTAAMGQADFALIMRASHRLKGGLKTVGAFEGADAARRLEVAAHARDVQEVVAAHAALDEILSRLIPRLKALS